jgi:hypothetical protein
MSTIEEAMGGMIADDQPPAPEPSRPPVEDGSIWGVARASHAELARKQQERKPLELDIGENGIVMRCKWFALHDTEKSVNGIAQLRSSTEQKLYAAIDMLILACDELLVRVSDEFRAEHNLPAGLVPLADPGDPPIRFDHRLCAGMGWEPMSVRKCVRKMFGGEAGDWPLIDAAMEVDGWLRGTGEDVAEDFATG